MSLVVRILLGNVTKALLIRRLYFVSQKKENLPYKKSPVRRELYKEQTAGGSSILLDKWTSWWGRMLGWIPLINLSLGSLVPWDSGNEAVFICLQWPVKLFIRPWNKLLLFVFFQIAAEQEVLKKMGEIREKIPKMKPGQKTKFQDDLVMLNELLQVRQYSADIRVPIIEMLTHNSFLTFRCNSIKAIKAQTNNSHQNHAVSGFFV